MVFQKLYSQPWNVFRIYLVSVARDSVADPSNCITFNAYCSISTIIKKKNNLYLYLSNKKPVSISSLKKEKEKKKKTKWRNNVRLYDEYKKVWFDCLDEIRENSLITFFFNERRKNERERDMSIIYFERLVSDTHYDNTCIGMPVRSTNAVFRVVLRYSAQLPS